MQTLWGNPPVLPCSILLKLRFLVGSVICWMGTTNSRRCGLPGWVYLVDGKLTQGALIACYLLSTRALAPIAQIAGLLTQYYQASSAFKYAGIKLLTLNRNGENLKGWG